jgi:hypothetical protein
MTLRAPFKIKEKFFTLNLNQYRNENFHLLNKAKVKFKEHMLPQVSKLPKMTQIGLKYIVYPGGRYLFDVSNVCSVVDKFLSDTLVECGVIPDDNWNHLPTISFHFGNIDRENPRIDVVITDLTTNTTIPFIQLEEVEMQITLNQEEIHNAIENYVRGQITVADNQEITIELRAGRGENGYTAQLDIRQKTVATAKKTTTRTAKDEPAKDAPEVQEDPKPTPEEDESLFRYEASVAVRQH